MNNKNIFNKKINEEDLLKRPILASEKYGNKKEIYKPREKKENKLLGFIIIYSVLFLIILLALIVYLTKK